jgi:L-asparaginase
MNYKIVNIRTTAKNDPTNSILIIYTGGTIGMIYDEDGSLMPFNFVKVLERIPEITSLELKMTVISFPVPIDSSNVNYKDWQDLGYIIYENYHQYDGFVILHGTDTMAYSASAISFMLQGLTKPIIFTGAQIPIGQIRSDARENIITALEIASAQNNGVPIVSEVCIYFNYVLLRGNRSSKIRSSTFAAFESPNYPKLAESGIFIEYNFGVLTSNSPTKKLKFKRQFDPHCAVLTIFPGITKNVVRQILAIDDLKGLVLLTYGSGNTMSYEWFIQELQYAMERGVIIYNVSQCIGGEVIQGRYETSKRLADIGVVGGGDITLEAALTKLMFLIGTEKNMGIIKEKLAKPLVGEMDF